MDRKGSAAMLTSAVSRCHIRGESADHTSEKARKASTLALNSRADVRPHENDRYLPKIFKKKKVDDIAHRIVLKSVLGHLH